MAHHPSFGLSPANGTLLVPRSYGSAASPVDLTSNAAYSSFKSILSTKTHDMLKPTATSCHAIAYGYYATTVSEVAMPIRIAILRRNVAAGAMSAEGHKCRAGNVCFRTTSAIHQKPDGGSEPATDSRTAANLRAQPELRRRTVTGQTDPTPPGAGASTSRNIA